ncbi:MAG: phosphoglycerate dehydrogenase [Rhodothermales bacterium]|nr:phosphoglycerate dehydrogenase [Rhodothermales bacterium]
MKGTVLITDNLDPVCAEILTGSGYQVDTHVGKSHEELLELARTADAWIVRSGTKITADLIEAADRLQVIGRAGVGVDNIDLEAATRRGVLVINAPDGNTISTAEHTCAMLMSAVRRIPQAVASLKGGEWNKKAFKGAEVNGKTLGIIGVGKIGQAVAQRMKSFGVKVLGYDPVLSREVADRIGVTLVSLEELLEQSDVITVHTPLSDSTRGLLNRDTLARCRDGVYIVNCARGGIVDEKDLLEAIESGKVAGAALDVYSAEPPPEGLGDLVRHPKVVATPHIAASTGEAQEKVAVQVTEQVAKALGGEPVTVAVNAMAIKGAGRPELRPYVRLADMLGRFAAQLCDGQVDRVTVKLFGDLPSQNGDVLSVAALKGLFGTLVSGPVNLVNAPFLAEEMGLQVDEQLLTSGDGYANLVGVVLRSGSQVVRVGGTVFSENDLRLVRIDDFRLEVRPGGYMLVYHNVDRPGVLASVGTILAEANINIAAMALGRDTETSRALTVIDLDDEVPASVLEKIGGLKDVTEPRLIRA